MADKDSLRQLIDNPSREDVAQFMMDVARQQQRAIEAMEASTQRHSGLTEWREQVNRWMKRTTDNIESLTEAVANNRHELEAQAEEQARIAARVAMGEEGDKLLLIVGGIGSALLVAERRDQMLGEQFAWLEAHFGIPAAVAAPVTAFVAILIVIGWRRWRRGRQ